MDPGGYFIINGSEKTCLGQERAAENTIYCFDINKNNTKWSYLAEIKSAPVWMTSIGQFIGSSLGLLIPLYIRGKIQIQPFDINIEVKSETTVYSVDELSPAFSKK